MKRHLASIQKITELAPISNADRIEVASVLGWKTVVHKNTYKIGDPCVYCEIDSVLPDHLDFPHSKRVKTVRLRGQISQGVVFPVSVLPEGTPLTIGTDVTEILGVTKWEPKTPPALSGITRGNFPEYVPKTEEPRLQSFPGILAEIIGVECYVTVKVDGRSGTFSNYAGDIHVCSRNWSIKEPEPGNKEDIYWAMFKKYDIGRILGETGNVAIQGEIVGPGIQKNPLGLDKVFLFVFDVYDIDKKAYFDFEDLVTFCTKYNLTMVPISYSSMIFAHAPMDHFLEMANIDSFHGPIEGLVIRPRVECYSQTLGGRLSFKIINNKYLLSQ